MRFFLLATSMLLLFSCCQSKTDHDSKMPELPFPYQGYLDDIGEDEYFPTIGNDGQGFDAISHNIVYPELPDTLSLSYYADSLLQFYNSALAFNTMAYDIGTAERYIGEGDFGLEQADALDSINLSGIINSELKESLRTICQKSANAIRSGKMPNEQHIPEISKFYDAFGKLVDPLYDGHFEDLEFNAKDVIADYAIIHFKAITDTTSFRDELLKMIFSETDFQKQCVLARELAYSNYHCQKRDDKQIVAVLDKLLRSGKYSPLLCELWKMWRCMLQLNILSSRSNDSAMYNLFYNDMRNRVALVYIAHMKSNPKDKLAFKEFARLVTTYNIVRNSEFIFGNNANLEDIELFYSVFHPENNADND